MYNEQIEALISAALADGMLTEKEKQVLFKKAQSQGIDLDEFEMVLDARLVELEKAEKAKVSTSAPQSTKYGNIRKCPVCGAMVPALAAVCPECGFEFSGIDANISSKKLADLLLDVSDIDKKEEIIITFPIPNTKADLFEFLSALQPRMRDINDPLSSAYFKKYQECINKAQILFANDPIFQPYFSSFEKVKRQIKLNIVKKWCLNHKGWTIGILFVVIFIIGSILTSIEDSKERAKKEKSLINLEQAILSKDIDKIMETLKESPRQDHPLELLTQLVNDGYLDAAIYFYNNKTSHCSTYEMQYEASYGNASFTKAATKLIYDALISSERMEEAWQYHPLDYHEPNYAGNANAYFSYINDVVNYYCKTGKKDIARQFVKEHLAWFVNNVDNGKYGKDYPDFYSAKVSQRLTKQINNY